MIQSKITKIIFFIIFLCTTAITHAQNQDMEGNDDTISDKLNITEVNYSINWTSNIVSTNVHISWEPTSLEQYILPKESMKTAQNIFPNIFAKIAEHIYVDGHNTLIDFARDHSSYKFVLSKILSDTVLKDQVPDKNLLGTRVSIDSSLSSFIFNIVYPSFAQKNMPYVPSTLVDNTEYTSVIFAVDNPISVIQDIEEQVYFEPKIIPRIYDSSIKKILYTPEYFQQVTSTKDRPFSYIYKDEYAQIETGMKPLLIIPQYITDKEGGDLVLNSWDSKNFLASQIVRELATQGNIFILISKPNIKVIE